MGVDTTIKINAIAAMILSEMGGSELKSGDVGRAAHPHHVRGDGSPVRL